MAVSNKNDELLSELLEHYHVGKDDMEIRKNRQNGWDDIIREYHGYLPDNWPYLSMVTDPIIRTKILEKNSRLFNAKLRGKLIPREGGDVVKAKIHNAILDYQWDAADFGGSMLEKWALMDIQTRLFGASFGLIYWKNCDSYEGNEFKVLDNRDVFIDPASDHVKNANWIQVREYVTLKELEDRNEVAGGSLYENLDELRTILKAKSYTSDRRATNYTSAVKEMRELEDRVGTDRSFPIVEFVTEYRNDTWYFFTPNHDVRVGEIENPLPAKKIPVIQLRYYPVGDDVYGDSEVEPIISLARALNAFHCSYIDAINLSMNPPIKVANNHEVRLDTLEYGPNAIWLIGSNPNNVMEHRTGDQAIAGYRTAVPAIKSAINTALGETSQGLSNMDFRESDKTATEIMDLSRQRQSRDQQNQLYLSESLKDQMMFWVSNNQKFLFSDPGKNHIVYKIIGRDMLEQLKELGLNDEDVNNDAMDILSQSVLGSGNIDQYSLKKAFDSVKLPKYPVILNPGEKDPEKFDIKKKLELDEDEDYGSLYVTKDDMPEDMRLDYIPDVKSMALGVGAERAQSRVRLLDMLINPAIGQKLAEEGKRLRVSEFIVKIMHNEGEPNPEKYLEDLKEANVQQAIQGQSNQAPGRPGGSGRVSSADANVGVEASGNPAGIPGAGALS